MEKKRSVKVTILAVLFILGGATNSISALFYFSGKYITQSEFSVDSYKDFIIKHNPHMSPQDLEKMTPSLEKMAQVQNELKNSNIFNIISVLNGVLGIIGLILGIGLFRLKEDARKGIIIFMLVSTPVMVIFNYISMKEMLRLTAKSMPEINRVPKSFLSFWK